MEAEVVSVVSLTEVVSVLLGELDSEVEGGNGSIVEIVSPLGVVAEVFVVVAGKVVVSVEVVVVSVVVEVVGCSVVVVVGAGGRLT